MYVYVNFVCFVFTFDVAHGDVLLCVVFFIHRRSIEKAAFFLNMNMNMVHKV